MNPSGRFKTRIARQGTDQYERLIPATIPPASANAYKPSSKPLTAQKAVMGDTRYAAPANHAHADLSLR